MDGRRYTHAIWADNIWLFAGAQEHLVKMVASLTDILDDRGLTWKPTSLQVMASTEENCPGFWISDTRTEMQVKPTESMEVLGTIVHRSGLTQAPVEHRLGRAVNAFWAEKDLYCDKCSPLYRRFQRFSTRIVPKALHGCGSWAWSKSLCQKLVVWEGSYLRRILGAGRRSDDDAVKHFRRTTRRARELYFKMGFEPLTMRVLRAVHKLAGELRQSNANHH
eukprot:1265654-Karenia_brevis.AAC.1